MPESGSAHPRGLGRIDGELGHERQGHDRALVHAQRRRRAAERDQVGFVEALEHRMPLSGDGRFLAGMRTVHPAPVFGMQPQVGVDGGRTAAASAGWPARWTAVPPRERAAHRPARNPAADLPTRRTACSRRWRPASRPAARTRGSTRIARRRARRDWAAPERRFRCSCAMSSACTGRYGMRARISACANPVVGRVHQFGGTVPPEEIGVSLRPDQARRRPPACGSIR